MTDEEKLSAWMKAEKEAIGRACEKLTIRLKKALSDRTEESHGPR
jgi:hypothetical protein